MARLAARLAPGDARDDTVQEALVRAWRKRGQYTADRGTPAAWLLAITADQARQLRRRRRPLAQLAEFPGRVQSSDDRLDVEHAVASLPTRQRLAVDCFYFAGLSVAETAAVMRCSEGTVKSTLSDARHRLRPLLEVDDVRR
jgi:RNA polymerase sigma-70 factor (ECF subfamily)